ncbi:MAG: tetratricopeptide repeat protein [Crocosphaera sp.]
MLLILWHPYIIRKKKYKKAEILFKESINIRKKLLGQIHPHVATAINNLALLYKLPKKYKD